MLCWSVAADDILQLIVVYFVKYHSLYLDIRKALYFAALVKTEPLKLSLSLVFFFIKCQSVVARHFFDLKTIFTLSLCAVIFLNLLTFICIIL